MMVVEEQQQLLNYERSVMRGDVANPDVATMTTRSI